jgi:hypothetical protein
MSAWERFSASLMMQSKKIFYKVDSTTILRFHGHGLLEAVA